MKLVPKLCYKISSKQLGTLLLLFAAIPTYAFIPNFALCFNFVLSYEYYPAYFLPNFVFNILSNELRELYSIVALSGIKNDSYSK